MCRWRKLRGRKTTAGPFSGSPVANATNHVDRQLDHILDFLEKDGRFAVVNIQKEIL